jgi:glycosyltransferase involved in cell wall biosynthesis
MVKCGTSWTGLLTMIDEPCSGSTAPPSTAFDGQALSAVVFGYMSSHLGVGESARLLMQALESAGIDARSIPVEDPWGSSLWTPINESPADPMTDVRFLCFNADQTPILSQHVNVLSVKSRYTIGLWHWEVEKFPDEFQPAFQFVDEVWAGSRFTQEAIAPHTSKPVTSMPPAIVAPPTNAAVNRSSLGIPPGFMFFFAFDHRSLLSRKNPIGLVQAFCKAFSPGEGPVLVIKAVNGSRFPANHRQLTRSAAGRPDIRIIDAELKTAEMAALMHGCDAYVSLHRSEGFGLTLAEAAACGKPVVSTAYSGPMDFLTDQNAYLVPYDLVTVGSGHSPYPREARWAEPDLRAASNSMRAIWKNPKGANARGARAREDVLAHHSPDKRGESILRRLHEIDFTASHSANAMQISSSARRHIAARLKVARVLSPIRDRLRRPRT